MKLNPSDCARAKPRPKPYKLDDGAGLYLYVAPGGGKLWRLDYVFKGRIGRERKNGKLTTSGRNTISLGAFPLVSLDDARAKREVALKQIKSGRDPAAENKVAKLTADIAQRQTFGLVAEELLEKMEREGKAYATVKKRRWLLTDLASDLKDRPIQHITPIEILSILRKAESRGHLESARRLRASIGQVFRLAVATNRAPIDPTPALRGAIAAPQVRHRAAVTTPEAAGKLMSAIEGYDGKVIRCGLLLAAYCFSRPGELRLAKWSEVDLRGKIWTIPAQRTKMRREHRIPLSTQAAKQFNVLWRLTGTNKDGLCFPGLRNGRPLSENTLNAALRTLGYDGKTHVAHGFRAMASTILNEHSDFSPDAIEKALGHMESNGVRRAYHRAEHWDERVKLMAWYADFLDKQSFKVWKDRALS